MSTLEVLSPAPLGARLGEKDHDWGAGGKRRPWGDGCVGGTAPPLTGHTWACGLLSQSPHSLVALCGLPGCSPSMRSGMSSASSRVDPRNEQPSQQGPPAGKERGPGESASSQEPQSAPDADPACRPLLSFLLSLSLLPAPTPLPQGWPGLEDFKFSCGCRLSCSGYQVSQTAALGGRHPQHPQSERRERRPGSL